MSITPTDLPALLKTMRYDLTALQGKLTDVLKIVATLELTSESIAGPNANSRRAYTPSELERLIDRGVINDFSELEAEAKAGKIQDIEAIKLADRLTYRLAREGA